MSLNNPLNLQDEDQYCQECGTFIGREGVCDDCGIDTEAELLDWDRLEDEDDYLNDF